MKVSIKRGQSQAGLSFAERENQRPAAVGKAKVRPQVKRKLLFIFALLLALAQGAWAQTTTYTSYTVTGGSVSYWSICEYDMLLDNNTGTKWCTHREHRAGIVARLAPVFLPLFESMQKSKERF